MSIHFEVLCFLGKKIAVTEQHWNYIVDMKHPIMRGMEAEVIETLKHPEEVRKSKKDPNTYLYYKMFNTKFFCVVCKHLNERGFIITTYMTDKIKEGELVWRK